MCLALVLRLFCMYLGCLLYNSIERMVRLQTVPCGSHHNFDFRSLIANPEQQAREPTKKAPSEPAPGAKTQIAFVKRLQRPRQMEFATQ